MSAYITMVQREITCLIPICHLVELARLIAWSHDLVNSGDRTLPRKWLGCIEHEPIKACHRAGF